MNTVQYFSLMHWHGRSKRPSSTTEGVVRPGNVMLPVRPPPPPPCLLELELLLKYGRRPNEEADEREEDDEGEL